MSYCKDCRREIDRAYEDMQAAEPWTKTGNMMEGKSLGVGDSV